MSERVHVSECVWYTYTHTQIEKYTKAEILTESVHNDLGRVIYAEYKVNKKS